MFIDSPRFQHFVAEHWQATPLIVGVVGAIITALSIAIAFGVMATFITLAQLLG